MSVKSFWCGSRLGLDGDIIDSILGILWRYYGDIMEIL